MIKTLAFLSNIRGKIKIEKDATKPNYNYTIIIKPWQTIFYVKNRRKHRCIESGQ
jgi:hypothetical protein